MRFSLAKKKLVKLIVPVGALVSSAAATTHFVTRSVPVPNLESLNFLDESHESLKLEENLVEEQDPPKPKEDKENQPQSEDQLSSSDSSEGTSEDNDDDDEVEEKEETAGTEETDEDSSGKESFPKEQQSESTEQEEGEKQAKEEEEDKKEKNKDLIQLNTGGKIAAAILGLALSAFDSKKD